MKHGVTVGQLGSNLWGQATAISQMLDFQKGNPNLCLLPEIKEWMDTKGWHNDQDYRLAIIPEDGLSTYEKIENSLSNGLVYRFQVLFRDPQHAMLFKLTWQ